MAMSDTFLRVVFAHSWIDDIDLGEFYLNFICMRPFESWLVWI
jgi:hypothetical protein